LSTNKWSRQFIKTGKYGKYVYNYQCAECKRDFQTEIMYQKFCSPVCIISHIKNNKKAVKEMLTKHRHYNKARAFFKRMSMTSIELVKAYLTLTETEEKINESCYLK